jgi:hypothetical protein
VTHAAKTLLSLANDQINAVEFYRVNPKWLLLYTDASLLLVAVSLRRSTTEDGRDLVRLLDMAIIVAGGAGRDRPQWVAALLKEAQDTIEINIEPSVEKPLRPLRKLAKLTSSNTVRSHLYAKKSVTEFQTAPSMLEYTTTHANSPFIVRGFAGPDSMLPWPALHRWKSAEYLLNAVGDARVVPVECGEAYVDESWGQKIMPFRTFLSRVGYDIKHETEATDYGTLYLAQYSLFRQFPILERDFAFPDYVWAQPQTSYPCVRTESGPVVNVWVGHSERHPVSPAHTVSKRFLREMRPAHSRTHTSTATYKF